MNKLIFCTFAILSLRAAAQTPPDPKAVDFNKVKGVEAKDLRNNKQKTQIGTDCQINGATYKPGEVGFDNCMNAAKSATPTTTGRGEADLMNDQKARDKSR